MNNHRVAIPIVALCAFACDLPTTVTDCRETESVVGVITLGPTDELVRDDLLVRGRAAHTGDLAIRRIEVAGVLATNGVVLVEGDDPIDGFNHSSWEATVPFDQLEALATQGGDGKVEVRVAAIDSCDRVSLIGGFEVTIDPNPTIVVEPDDFDLEIIVPGSTGDATDYLPTTGSIEALVTISANPEASGAVVTLDTSLGAFQGNFERQESESTGTVVLRGGSDGQRAEATVFLSADTSGIALVTASVGDLLEQRTVTVSAPPRLVPSTGTLGPGQTIGVTIFTEGSLDPDGACIARPAPGVTVLSADGVDLMVEPGVTDADGTFEISVDGEPVEGVDAEVVDLLINCQDVYGQAASGLYQARLAQPSSE